MESPPGGRGSRVEKLRLAEEIVQYRFPAAPTKHYGFNITALLDLSNRRTLLIDTAYEEQAAAVYADLTRCGFALAGVIVSHFHPDHVSGLKALPDCTVYGSERYEESLCEYAEDERCAFMPTYAVCDGMKLSFGSFELSFRLAPGHAPCSMHTVIGERFVHVADDIMTSNDGQAILPWAPYEDVRDLIESLQALERLPPRTLLLSHGIALSDPASIRDAVSNRVRYLQAVLSGHGRVSFDTAVAGCTCRFLHEEWHIGKD